MSSFVNTSQMIVWVICTSQEIGSEAHLQILPKFAE